MVSVHGCICMYVQKDPLGGYLRKSRQRLPGDRELGGWGGGLGIFLENCFNLLDFKTQKCIYLFKQLKNKNP